MPSLRAPWQNGPYEKTHNKIKHVEHQDATDILKNTHYVCVFQRCEIWVLYKRLQINDNTDLVIYQMSHVF